MSPSITSASSPLQTLPPDPEKHPRTTTTSSSSSSTTITIPALAPAPDAGPNVSPPLSSSESSPFPDGGLTAWLNVFGSALAMFCTFGFVNCIGTFEAYYVQGPLSNYSSSTVSWIASTQVFIMTLGGLFFGPIFDNYGPRLTLCLGSLLYVFGLMMTSLSTTYYQIFLSQAITASLGSAAVFNHTLSSLSTWFLRRRAAAFGIAAAGSSLGGVILPIMIDHLIPRVGFPWTMRIVAFMFLGMLSVTCLTIRSRLPPAPKPISITPYISLLRCRLLVIVICGMWFFFWGMFLPFTYILLQAQTSNIPATLIPYLLPILNACSIAGRILPGLAADKLGRFNVTIFVVFFSAILTLALWIPGKSAGAIIAYVALFGFASGGYISLTPTVVAQIVDIREIGVAVGLSFGCQSFAALTGPPIAGAIVSRANGDYLGLQLFCGIVMFIGSFFFVIARYMQVGFRLVKV